MTLNLLDWAIVFVILGSTLGVIGSLTRKRRDSSYFFALIGVLGLASLCTGYVKIFFGSIGIVLLLIAIYRSIMSD